jgi:hypothetical protein
LRTRTRSPRRYRVFGEDIDDDVGVDEDHPAVRSAFVRCGAAHERDYFVRGHFEIAVPTEAFDKILAARFAAGGLSSLDQTDSASFDFELDVGAGHEAGALPHMLGDGNLALGCDPHGGHFLTGVSKNSVGAYDLQEAEAGAKEAVLF